MIMSKAKVAVEMPCKIGKKRYSTWTDSRPTVLLLENTKEVQTLLASRHLRVAADMEKVTEDLTVGKDK